MSEDVEPLLQSAPGGPATWGTQSMGCVGMQTLFSERGEASQDHQQTV